jgi:histone chaperone ASF1
VLQEAEMDCSQAGQMRFVLEADAPNPAALPEQDTVGVTAVLLTCSYKENEEFLRVGYYVNIEYDTPEMNENPPARPDISRLTRHILAEKPRVTKF